MLTYFLSAALVLLACSSCSWAEDEDEDDIKGPLMPVKPDGGLYATDEIINERKHKGEKHTVTSGDGYELTVFRVAPEKEGLPVALLQHGYLLSSDCWVSDPGALAFKLSDSGFDVWLSNARGNAYARKHAKLSPDEKDFWNFSWHEMGAEDLPTVIDYILKKTGQEKLHYVGHSLGTTMGFVMATSKPEYNKKLKSLVALVPVVYLSKLVQMVGPEGMAEEMANKFLQDVKDSGKFEVFPRKDVPANPKTQITCDDAGENFKDMCTEKMEGVQGVLGGAYIPAGTSYRTMFHVFQMSRGGSMNYYKYDTPEENKEVYVIEEPPSYVDKFKLITAPVLIWSTEADQVVMPEDVDQVVAKLPNVVEDNRIKDVDCFDHVAFLFPRQKSCIPEREKVYTAIIEAMKKLDTK